MEQQVAKEILNQLGGNRFCTMVGVKSLISTPTSLAVRFVASRVANRLVIDYIPATDYYSMKFYRVRAGKQTLVEQADDIGCEGLQTTFETVTGLATHL